MCSIHRLRYSTKLPVQYFNVPDKYLGDLPDGTTYGKGSFREVRLLVDGKLAGVAFPYPVIYTGGFVPAAWRWVLLCLSCRLSLNRCIPDQSLPTGYF